MAQWKRVWLVSMRMQVRSLASLSRSGIWRCCDLWCRSQIQLGLDPALLWLQRRQAWFIGRHDSTPSLGTSICHRCGPKKQKKQEREKENIVVAPALASGNPGSPHSGSLRHFKCICYRGPTWWISFWWLFKMLHLALWCINYESRSWKAEVQNHSWWGGGPWEGGSWGHENDLSDIESGHRQEGSETRMPAASRESPGGRKPVSDLTLVEE